VRQSDIVAVLVAHSRFRKISREELMRRVVIDVTGLTHGICQFPQSLERIETKEPKLCGCVLICNETTRTA
jgi:hypothetical protein